MADFAQAEQINTPELVPSSPTQADVLPAFSNVITEKAFSMIAELRAVLSPEANEYVNDIDCQRYIIARDYNIEKAAARLIEYHKWHLAPMSEMQIANQNMRPCDLAATPADDKEEQLKLVAKYSYNGEDKEGCPIFWERSGVIAQKWVQFRKTHTDDELYLRHVRMQEVMQLRCRLQSQRLGKLVSKKLIILDLTNIPVLLDWSLLRILKRFGEVDEGMYPETLKVLFVINAPIYFTAIWAIVKPFVDPETISKMQILGANYLPTLLEHINADQIPVEYGGTNENFSWEAPSNYIMPV